MSRKQNKCDLELKFLRYETKKKKMNKLDLTKLSALESTHKKSHRLGKNICKTHYVQNM